MNWMIWINSIFILLLLNAALGCGGYRVWIHIRSRFEERCAYQTIYQMHKLVIGLFWIPSILLVLLCPGLRQLLYRELFLGGTVDRILEPVLFALFICWLAGMGRMLVKTCRNGFRFREVEKYNTDLEENVTEILDKICTRHQYYHTIRLAENPFVPIPMISGAVRRMILLPEDTYDMQELEMILEHELVHAKKHDLVYKQLALITRIVFWFAPDAVRQEQDLDEWCETCCDIEMCCKPTSVWKKKQYFQTLVSRAQEIQERELNVSYALCGDMNAICRRMRRMKQYAMAVEEKRIRIAGYMVLSLALVLFCGMGAARLGSSLYGLHLEKQFEVASGRQTLAKGSDVVCAGERSVMGKFRVDTNGSLNFYIETSSGSMTGQADNTDATIYIYDEDAQLVAVEPAVNNVFPISVKKQGKYFFELENHSNWTVRADYLVAK